MAHQLRWLGHAAWQLTTKEGKVLFVDPWLSENPVAASTIQQLPQGDYILLTHDHDDHASDVPAVVEQTGATLIAQLETTNRYREAGVPEDKTLLGGMGMNIGGTYSFDN